MHGPADCQPLFDQYQIKGFKSHQGHDTLSFTGTLYDNGKPVATVSNDGNGGCHHITFYPAAKRHVRGGVISAAGHQAIKEASDRFSAATHQIPVFLRHRQDTPVSTDELIDLLVERTQMDRKARTKTLLRRDLGPYRWELLMFTPVLTGAELRRAVTENLPSDQWPVSFLWVTRRGWVPMEQAMRRVD